MNLADANHLYHCREMVRLKAGAFVAIASALVFCGEASAQNADWTTSGTGSWYNSTNWNEGETAPAFIGNPSAGTDDLGFNMGSLDATVVSSVDNATSINSLSITGGGIGSSLQLTAGCAGYPEHRDVADQLRASTSPVEIERRRFPGPRALPTTAAAP